MRPAISFSDQFAVLSSGSSISVRTRLAVTLRWLAGGSYLDICFGWGIASSTFYSDRGALWPTIQATDVLFELGFPINDINALTELERGFSEHSNGAMNGLVTVIDGLAVRVRQPYKSESEKPRDYCYRKGGFAVIVMAGADVNGRFTFASCKHSGSTNDYIAWETTALCDALVSGSLDERYN